MRNIFLRLETVAADAKRRVSGGEGVANGRRAKGRARPLGAPDACSRAKRWRAQRLRPTGGNSNVDFRFNHRYTNLLQPLRRRLKLVTCGLFGVWVFGLGVLSSALALDITLPTANHALYSPSGEEQFYQGTAGHDWHSGQYGCVRSGGHQYHEGIDVRCLERDRHGEPTDRVVAIADGEVAYVASVGGQSNYGRYVLVRHRWDGVEVFSLYAHLAGFAPGLRAGQAVKRGDWIAVLGHSGTQNIPKDRAHLHLEICFQINRNFAAWFAPRMAKGDRNDHANYNGINLQGIDPAAIFLATKDKPSLNFREYMESQPVAFTALFPARRPPLSCMRAQPWCNVNGPEPKPVTAYEVWFMAEGVATFVRPRTDVTTPAPRVLTVNEPPLISLPARRLVERDAKRRGWQFTTKGGELMEMLCFQ